MAAGMIFIYGLKYLGHIVLSYCMVLSACCSYVQEDRKECCTTREDVWLSNGRSAHRLERGDGILWEWRPLSSRTAPPVTRMKIRMHGWGGGGIDCKESLMGERVNLQVVGLEYRSHDHAASRRLRWPPPALFSNVRAIVSPWWLT